MKTGSTFIALILIASTPVLSQDTTVPHAHSPRSIPAWSYRMSVGTAITVLPRPVAEEEIRQIPMLDLFFREGLPWNFSIAARINSNVITNYAAGGFQWSFDFGRFSASIGDMHGYWYGFANIDGFDVDAYGWLNHPFASLGLSFDDVLVHIRAEAQIIISRHNRAGSIEIHSEKNFLAGGAFSLILEQPLLHSTCVVSGIRLNYTRSAVQSWLAYSTFRDYQIYPEFIFGFIL